MVVQLPPWFSTFLRTSGIKLANKSFSLHDAIYPKASTQPGKSYIFVCFQATITIAVAKRILAEFNAHNRSRTRGRVQAYLESILCGLWFANGVPIVFDRHGQLLDGSHRLAAFISSGDTTYKLMVVAGIPTEAFITFDRGAARSGKDVFDTLRSATPVTKNQAVNYICRYSWDLLHTKHSETPTHEARRDIQSDLGLLLDRATALAYGFNNNAAPHEASRAVFVATYVILTLGVTGTYRPAAGILDAEKAVAHFLFHAFNPDADTVVEAGLPKTGAIRSFWSNVGDARRAVAVSHYTSVGTISWAIQAWNKLVDKNLTSRQRTWKAPAIPSVASEFQLLPTEDVLPPSDQQLKVALEWWRSLPSAAAHAKVESKTVKQTSGNGRPLVLEGLGLSPAKVPSKYEIGIRRMLRARSRTEASNRNGEIDRKARPNRPNRLGIQALQAQQPAKKKATKKKKKRKKAA